MRLAVALLLGLLFAPSVLEAQGVRGWSRTTLRYVQLRPLRLDTLALDQVTVGDDGVRRYEGLPVACVPGLHCTLYRMQPLDHVVHGSQDLSLTAWGLGVRGLSTTLLLRGRADVAGDFQWPRSDDPFDVFLAYAQLDRGPLRLRAGRQEIRSGLGFSSFDGGSVRWRALRRLRVEAYGGRSLARGLREPRDEALRGLQRFLPDNDAWLLGGALEAQPFRGTAVTARYQREIWSDRSALISERASVDVRSAALAPLRIDASADYDFAFGRVGKAHLTLGAPAPGLPVGLEATLRRYVPYFELHTIWGFFDPVAYHEAELRASWTGSRGLGAWASGARRWYEDTHTSSFMEPMSGDAWRGTAGLRWRPLPGWSLSGRYRLEWANGGFLNSGDVTVGWNPHDRVDLSATGTALQQFEEFRLGEAAAVGAGATASVEITPRIDLQAGLSAYRRLTERRVFEESEDWSQLRGWSSVRVEIGGDPGLRDGGR